MSLKEILTNTKGRIIYLIIIALTIIISGILSRNEINCFQAPCYQPTSTIIGRFVYNIVTFDRLIFIREFIFPLRNAFFFGDKYFLIGFIIIIILHYILISLIIWIYGKIFKKKKY